MVILLHVTLVMNPVQGMYLNSGMARLHHTATFCSVVLGLAVIISGVSCTETCSPQTLPSSHSVHAYDDQPIRCLSGCVGAASPDLSVAEVHVVNLQSSSSTSSTSPTSSSTSSTNSESNLENVADFHFKPKQGGIFARSLVFVLNSATPVRWRIKGENMFSIPAYTIKIVVPNNSCQSVTWNSEISLSVNRICSSLPQNNSDLLSSVQDQYGSVTSFSEVLGANAFVLLVGSGIRTPSSCLIQPDFQTPDFTARYVLEQPTIGCQTQEVSSPLQPEFHIILLHDVAGTQSPISSDPPHVMIELQPARNGESTCDIVLVLVSEVNVTWTISAGRRSGVLQVESPNSVEMQEDLMNRLEKREVPRTISALLQWAEMEAWPLTTLTKAERANKFVVTLEQRNTPTKEPPSRHSIIKEYTQEMCHREGIQILIPRRVMEVFQLSAENMMLRDHSCRAVESGEYYVIETQLDQCGTTMTVMDTGWVVYHNEVIFSNSESVMEGSGEVDRERLTGEPPVDDEQSLTTVVPFTCEYGSNGDPFDKSRSRPQITIFMDMYTGNSFAQKQLVFPHTVQTGERVYFEVGLRDSAQLSIVPSQCWLSTGLKMLVEQLHILIYKGCPKDESLIFHRGVLDSGQTRRFSYEAPDISWEAMYYIHCELGICSRDGTGSSRGIPPCASIMDPETECLVVNERNGLVVDFPTQSLYLGPFKTLTSSIATPNDGNPILKGNEDAGKVIEQKEDCEAEGLGTGPAAAIAVASFVMGMVLMGALWFIHTHTGPHTGPPPSASPCTVSTASSPSANGHLVNGHIPNGAVPNGVVPNGAVPNGHIPSGFTASRLNPNTIPLQGMRPVDPLPEDV